MRCYLSDVIFTEIVTDPKLTMESTTWPDSERIKKSQMDFFLQNRSGCAFAAVAAKNPTRYGWHQAIVAASPDSIDNAVTSAIADVQITTLSLIFPSVTSQDDLVSLIETFRFCHTLTLGQDDTYAGFQCLGFRAKVGDKLSWITGFGAYSFFPKTRQTPFTEITMRVKLCPSYASVMKKAPEGVLHLAHLDMLGEFARAAFRTLWFSSLDRTATLLGHKPNLCSAAKTTFSLPMLECPNGSEAV